MQQTNTKTTVTADIVANAARQPLEQLIQRFVEHNDEVKRLDEQINALNKQLGSELPDAAKRPLEEALNSLREARKQIQGPVLEKIALGILHVVRPMNVPLTLESKNKTATTSTPGRNRGERGKLAAIIVDHLKEVAHENRQIRVSDLSNVVEELGYRKESLNQTLNSLKKKGQIKTHLPKGSKRNRIVELA